MHALLDAAAVPEPYLLVGFSFGGLLAIMYAATYPDQLIPADERERVMAEQVQFTKTVPNGRLVEVQSSHDIDLDKPELVLQEVQRILDTAYAPIRLTVANQAGAPSSWNLVCTRSGSMAATSHPVLGSNAALSSS